MSQEIKFTVPLVPPSVNHYKMRTRRGVTFVTKEAKEFKAQVGWAAMAQLNTVQLADLLEAKTYEVEIIVYQGFNGKGDVDNYAKCVLDGMVEQEVIYSDAAITDLILRKRRDAKNPRTEITVRAI